MIVERKNNEIIVKIPASINSDDLQDFLDFSRYKELTSKAEVSQDEIDDLANEINKSWWEENKENLKR